MDAIVTVLIIAALCAINFFITMVKEMPGKKSKVSEELTYLYTYKSILKQAAAIEQDLDRLGSHSYFTHMDANFIKGQTRAQINQLIKSYEQGITNGHAVQAQLNQLSDRIQSLAYAVAV